MTDGLLVGVAFRGSNFDLGWKLMMFISNLEIDSALNLYFQSGFWEILNSLFHLTLDRCILLSQQKMALEPQR